MQINASKAIAELCRRSLFEFVQEFWEVIIPEDPIWNWHIKYICDEVQTAIMRVVRLPEKPAIFEGVRFTQPAKKREQKLYDLLVNVPPGSLKSTIITVMAPAWAWTIDQTLRIISASYSGDLSQDHAVRSRDIIQSPKYKSYFPEIEIRADQNNKNNYKNMMNGERYATSVGGTVMGIHAHLIIIDDPLNTKQSISEADLPAAASFVNTTLSTRKVDKAVTLTIMVMQRLNELDPAGVWLRQRDQEGRKIKHICLPVRLSPKVYPPELKQYYINGLLDPVRLDEDVLANAKIELGSYGFAGQMDQDPAPEGGGVWQKWFIPVADKDMPSSLQMKNYGTDWDTAYTDKLTNAGSAAVVSGMFDGKMYIDAVQWFHKEFPELINTMKLFPDPHYIEAKACFAAGTLVRTDKGLKDIALINEHDFVLSFNEKPSVVSFKKIKNTLVFDSFQCLCIFKLQNGETLKVTTNHEFYINGGWHTAGSIARRIMEICFCNERELFNIEQRSFNNQELEKSGVDQVYETGARQLRLPANDVKDRRSFENSKNSPVSCSGIYRKSFEKKRSKPYRCGRFSQRGRKFGVGNQSGKPTTFSQIKSKRRFQNRAQAYKSCERLWQLQQCINGANRSRNSGEVQTTRLYQKDVSGGIRGKYSYDNRLHTPGLEAREISLADIKSVSFVNEILKVYDLQVEDNFTYCVTVDNYIVHNSGKSAKQTLITAGIPAIEVQVNSDKLARARDATPKAEAGLVFVRASILEKIYYDSDQGILKFPNGAKQDLADTIAQAIQRHFGRPERKFAVGWRKNRPVTESEPVPVVSLLND